MSTPVFLEPIVMFSEKLFDSISDHVNNLNVLELKTIRKSLVDLESRLNKRFELLQSGQVNDILKNITNAKSYVSAKQELSHDEQSNLLEELDSYESHYKANLISVIDSMLLNKQEVLRIIDSLDDLISNTEKYNSTKSLPVSVDNTEGYTNELKALSNTLQKQLEFIKKLKVSAIQASVTLVETNNNLLAAYTACSQVLANTQNAGKFYATWTETASSYMPSLFFSYGVKSAVFKQDSSSSQDARATKEDSDIDIIADVAEISDSPLIDTLTSCKQSLSFVPSSPVVEESLDEETLQLIKEKTLEIVKLDSRLNELQTKIQLHQSNIAHIQGELHTAKQGDVIERKRTQIKLSKQTIKCLRKKCMPIEAELENARLELEQLECKKSASRLRA